MASGAAVPFLVAMMLLTGVCNTLLTKYQVNSLIRSASLVQMLNLYAQDNQCVRNCDATNPSEKAHFNQPVLQTAQMFVGEMGCWLVIGIIEVYRRYTSSGARYHDGYRVVGVSDAESVTDPDDEMNESVPNSQPPKTSTDDEASILKGVRVFLLALPALCDICGTTLMNAGLLMVAASIYQMTRGALVLFVGLFSVIFLRRRLRLFQWLSLIGVVLGVAVVGLAGAVYPDHTDNKLQTTPKAFPAEIQVDDFSSTARAVIGVLLIAGAQIFTATQFVLEEWILERSQIEPIKVVGWEGIFGFVTTVACMVILHVAIGRTARGRYGYFDMVEGWRQLTQYPSIYFSSILIMISIG